VFDYLKTFKKAKLVFDYRDFTHDSVEEIEHSWGDLYPNAKEELPKNMPKPKMKAVKIRSIYDASHAPCLITRRSVTGIMLLLNNVHETHLEEAKYCRNIDVWRRGGGMKVGRRALWMFCKNFECWGSLLKEPLLFFGIIKVSSRHQKCHHKLFSSVV